MSYKRHLIAFASGLLFAIGLGLSTMTLPEKVVGFLDVFSLRGAWDPTLLLVLVSAVGTYALLFRLTVTRARPALGGRFRIPTRTEITAPLLIGSSLFGIGWGLSGFCPGPALASLMSGSVGVLVFVVAMSAGMRVSRLFE